MSGAKDITNQRFGRLTAIKCIGSNKHRNRVWECVCDCGNYTKATVAELLSGNTSSCGCLRDESASERFGKHHGVGTHLYRTWKNMKQRCCNPKNNKYHNYGGKGIKICDEWVNDFKSFQEWSFKHGYKKELTIERKDPNGDYEPRNCEWIPFSEQHLNKSNAVKMTINGNEYYIKELSKKHEIPYGTLLRRYYDGWDLNIIFKKPKMGFKRQYHT